LFEELKGSAAFAGLVVGRHLHTHPYFISCLYFSNSVALLAGHLCEFHNKQWVEPCSVPVSCLNNNFLQSTVCRSAVNCLNSWRMALLLQDRWREGAFICTLLPSDIAIVFVPCSTTWPWRITFLCWRVQ
jgi:hypothetical protein